MRPSVLLNENRWGNESPKGRSSVWSDSPLRQDTQAANDASDYRVHSDCWELNMFFFIKKFVEDCHKLHRKFGFGFTNFVQICDHKKHHDSWCHLILWSTDSSTAPVPVKRLIDNLVNPHCFSPAENAMDWKRVYTQIQRIIWIMDPAPVRIVRVHKGVVLGSSY